MKAQKFFGGPLQWARYIWRNVAAVLVARYYYAALGIVVVLLIGFMGIKTALATAPAGSVPKKWTVELPRKICPWSSTITDCHLGSPVLADLNGDGLDDIVAVTNNGHVVAVRNDGVLMWDTDVAPFFGMAAGTQEIASSPAVGDIDADGFPEIAVGAGTIYPGVCTQGGMIVLKHNGNVEPGWPQLADDWGIGPKGCRDSIYSSPAIGDLDNDGDMEIVAGGFDFRMYAWHHNGTLVAGFPPDSALYTRYPWWELDDRLGDPVWSSPALADLDRDGYLDIIIGTEEGNQGGGWTCPYALPAGWRDGYCGGSIYVLDHQGNLKPGFPRYIYETIQSAPAIADLDGDGWLDIVIGTGTFYYEFSPDHPTLGARVYAFDKDGNDLPGWGGGKAVGAVVPASPSVGDIDGDGKLEVVVATYKPEKKLYAWQHSGQLVPGFPMTPRSQSGSTLNEFNTPSNFIMADYNGDGDMEILFNQSWGVAVVDGNGRQLTADGDLSKPYFLTDGSLSNNPAVGDIDGDGKLELIASGNKLHAWDLPNSTNTKADWPMFRRDAHHTGRYPSPPRLAVSPDVLHVMHQEGSGNTETVYVYIENAGEGVLSWQITSTPPSAVVNPSSGTTSSAIQAKVTVNTAGYNPGTHSLGTVVITGMEGNNPVEVEIPLSLYVGDLYRAYIPLTMRSAH